MITIYGGISPGMTGRLWSLRRPKLKLMHQNTTYVEYYVVLGVCTIYGIDY